MTILARAHACAIALIAGAAILATAAFAQQGGTAEEAKAMLNKAVAAVKADKTKALDMFNKGEGGFRDRDLYVFCNNASDAKLLAILVCPACRGRVKALDGQQGIECEGCGRVYPVRDGIPVMIVEEATRPSGPLDRP